MTHSYQDPSDDSPKPSRHITPATRRDIFDYLRTEGAPWWGRMGEVEFLSRVYDLEELPSDDRRYTTAHRDIIQHRVYNTDWDDDWVFTDPRFQLMNGPDEKLLEFLSQMVHPVVQSSHERAYSTVCSLNRILAPDGWELRAHKQMSGRPVYEPARVEGGAGVAVDFAHSMVSRLDSAYISQQVTRMEGAVDSEPELAIGTAKEFVESVCKTILDEQSVRYERKEDIPALVRKTVKVLPLVPDELDSSARAANLTRQMTMNLSSLLQGLAEMRNAYGTGHGRPKSQSAQQLTPSHARLAVGIATSLGVFLYEVHEGHRQNIP